MSDVFESNDCLKASLVVDFNNSRDSFLNNNNIDSIVFTTDFLGNICYGYVNTERDENGEIDKELNDFYIDEDYKNGSVSRLFISVENNDSILLFDSNFKMIGQDVYNKELENTINKAYGKI